VGALSEVKGIVVTDVFGVRTLIRPAAALPDSQQHHWGMYGLTAVQEDKVDTRLFLPPTVAHLQQSTPLEKVILARDEMANMVWGIEEIIPNLAGGGTNGYEAATDLKNYLMAQAALPAGATPIATGATIQYKLGTQVPENWIPFIPVHNPGSNRDIRLQRAAMPRLIAGLPEKPVEPRGTILRPGLDAVTKESYFINEEEVAVDVVIGRTYQRVRWQDGHIYTWLGRWKQIEKGPGSSGLVFDQITHTE
jgi:hypothetical protein